MLTARGSLQPERYAEAPCERPGFLLAASKPPCTSRAAASLQRLVAVRQQQAERERALERAAFAADRLCRRALTRRALAALRHAVQAAAAAAVQADQLRQKWAFLRFAAAFTAWRAAQQRRRWLEERARSADALRCCTLAARALSALQQNVARCLASRRDLAQADSYRDFCLLLRGVEAWRRAAAQAERQRQLTAAAVLQWAARLARQVLAAWRLRVQQRQRRQRQGELAAAYCHHARLSAALGAWRAAAQRGNELRAAAEHTIRHALYGSAAQVAAMCLRGWRLHARRKAQLREAAQLAGRLRRFALLSTALQA